MTLHEVSFDRRSRPDSRGLRGVLKDLRRDATVLEAANCHQAERLVEEHTDLEVILLDLNLPDGDGFRLLAQLRERYPAISIIVLSASNDRDYVVRALDLGAVDLFRNPGSAPLWSALECFPAVSTFHPKSLFATRC